MHDDLRSALTLHQAGRLGDAAELYRRVLVQEPENPDALHLLGMLHLQQRQPARAAELIERAIALRPNVAAFHTNLAEVYRALGQPQRAADCCGTALRLVPNHPPALFNWGLALLGMGRHAAAAEQFRRVLALRPEVGQVHHVLGLALRGLGATDEALAHFRRALALDPKFAPARSSLAETQLAWGRLLQDQGRLDEARVQYEAALAAEPTSVAARVCLGGLHEAVGDFALAEADFRTARQLAPDHPWPHIRLATLCRGQLSDADIAALQERLARPDLNDLDRTQMLFGLAGVLDARGDYVRAADCAGRAHAHLLAAAPSLGRAYDPGEHERFVDDVLAAFGAPFFARVAGAGLATRRPVFVFGLPRSGTSLIEQILASHPDVHGGGELKLAAESFKSIPAVLGRPGLPLACVHELSADAIRRLAAAHLAELDRLDGGRAARVVDKMPHNYTLLGLLATLFPQATFIHCRRDLRDVAVSCWMTSFLQLDWTNDPRHLAARIVQYRRLVDHWRAVLPVAVHEAHYEEVVTDLEGATRRLLAACGLDWHPACLDFHRTRRAIRTASVVQIRRPVHTQSVGRWRHYECELGELLSLVPVQ